MNTYSEYEGARLADLNLDEETRNFVNNISIQFKEANPVKFENSQELYDFIINFVYTNRSEFNNDNTDLKVEFMKGVLQHMGIDEELRLADFFRTSLTRDFKNTDISWVTEENLKSLKQEILHHPYLSKDFILGVSGSRLNTGINDFLYSHCVVSFINMLSLIEIKLDQKVA